MQNPSIFLFILVLSISVTAGVKNFKPAGSPTTPKTKTVQQSKPDLNNPQNPNDLFKGMKIQKQPEQTGADGNSANTLEEAVVSLKKNIALVNSKGSVNTLTLMQADSNESVAVASADPKVIKKPLLLNFGNTASKMNLPIKANVNINNVAGKIVDQRLNKNEKANSEGQKKIDTGSPVAKQAVSDLKNQTPLISVDKKANNQTPKLNLNRPTSPLSKIDPSKKNMLNKGPASPISNNKNLKQVAGNMALEAVKKGLNDPDKPPSKDPQGKPSLTPLNLVRPLPLLKKKSSNDNALKRKPSSNSFSNNHGSSANKKAVQSIEEPIEVAWELGLIKKYLISKNKAAAYTQLKALIAKADAVLKMYLSTTTNYSVIPISPGSHCGVMVNTPLQIKAKLVILVDVMAGVYYDPVAIAQARSCIIDPKTNRSLTGIMRINPDLMVKESSSQLDIHEYLMTLVHETLHVYAFYGDQDTLLAKEVDPRFTHLNIIKNSGQQIFDGHWNEQFIPSDIEIRYERPDSIITVQTLEVLGHRSSQYTPHFENLAADVFLNSVENESDFFNYKCKDDDPAAKYASFCSPLEKENEQRHCSLDYRYKTYCDNQLLSNNCYRRAAFEMGSCVDPSHVRDKLPFEHIGSDARCFSDPEDTYVSCLKFTVADDSISIIVNDQSYECTSEGQIIDIMYPEENGELYTTAIKCPNIQNFIDQYNKTTCPEDCNYNGFCSNGQCLCFDGFSPKSHCKERTHTASTGIVFSETLK